MAIVILFDINKSSEQHHKPAFMKYYDNLVGYIKALNIRYMLRLFFRKHRSDTAYSDLIRPVIMVSQGDSIRSQVYPFQSPYEIINEILSHPKQYYFRQTGFLGEESREWFQMSSHFSCSIGIGQRFFKTKNCKTLDTVLGYVFNMAAVSNGIQKSLAKSATAKTIQPRVLVYSRIQYANEILNDTELVISLILKDHIKCEDGCLEEIKSRWDTLIQVIRSEMDRTEYWCNDNEQKKFYFFMLSKTKIPETARHLVDYVSLFLENTHRNINITEFIANHKDEQKISLEDRRIVQIYKRLNDYNILLGNTEKLKYWPSLKDVSRYEEQNSIVRTDYPIIPGAI